MDDAIKELHAKAEEFRDKHGDQELHDYLLTVAAKLEQFEMLKHHFGYFVMHAKAVCPYDTRPKHFKEALERAERILEAG